MMHKAPVLSSRVLLATLSALLLSGCISDRFSSRSTPIQARSSAPYNAPTMVEPIEPVVSGPVTSAPLPPPPGAPGPVAGLDPNLSPTGPTVADVPTIPPPEPTPVPATASAPSEPSRSSVVGSWRARDAAGASCRVQLSSSPALDLYRASSSGCSNKDLSQVTAWDYRNGEVFLYQPGGTVAARLRPGSGALDGVIAKSGAPLALSREGR